MAGATLTRDLSLLDRDRRFLKLAGERSARSETVGQLYDVARLVCEANWQPTPLASYI